MVWTEALSFMYYKYFLPVYTLPFHFHNKVF